jgi:hypothetical protein
MAEVSTLKVGLRALGAVRRAARWAALTIAWCALGLASVAASAAQLSVEGGRSYMDSHPATVLFVEGVFASHPLGGSRITWAPDVSLGWIGGRRLHRYDGARYTPRDAVWLAAAGIRLQPAATDAWYRHLFFSEQLAVQNRHSLALSSDYEFVSSVGWQGEHFSFQLRHISNAGLHGPNRGETMALLGIGFAF